MPQIKLEYSDNLTPASDWSQIFNKVHTTLNELSGVPIENCKSRAIPREQYYVGEGGTEKAFVHMEVALLDGRTKKEKHKAGEVLLKFLNSEFEESSKAKTLQITIEFRDIIRDNYFKIPKGTLSQPK